MISELNAGHVSNGFKRFAKHYYPQMKQQAFIIDASG
jgi:hypothetical protein